MIRDETTGKSFMAHRNRLRLLPVDDPRQYEISHEAVEDIEYEVPMDDGDAAPPVAAGPVDEAVVEGVEERRGQVGTNDEQARSPVRQDARQYGREVEHRLEPKSEGSAERQAVVTARHAQEDEKMRKMPAERLSAEQMPLGN